MLDLDTFLTTVYVLICDECVLPEEPVRPGPAPSLSREELLTLAILGQWQQFPSEQAFYRWASREVRPFFRSLPSRPQYNRLLRRWSAALTAVGLQLGERLARQYSVLDTFGVATRNPQRRGRGWLAGQAALGRCSRLGWFHGLRILSVVGSSGALTGYAIAPGNAGERAEAEALLALRAYPTPAAPTVGVYTAEPYLADKGFYGVACLARWRQHYGASVLAPPERTTRHPWPLAAQRQHAGWRQIVETVHQRLLGPFGLARERPHTLAGFAARLAAKVALHNLCLCLNQRDGRPLLTLIPLCPC